MRRTPSSTTTDAVPVAGCGHTPPDKSGPGDPVTDALRPSTPLAPLTFVAVAGPPESRVLALPRPGIRDEICRAVAGTTDLARRLLENPAEALNAGLLSPQQDQQAGTNLQGFGLDIASLTPTSVRGRIRSREFLSLLFALPSVLVDAGDKSEELPSLAATGDGI